MHRTSLNLGLAALFACALVSGAARLTYREVRAPPLARPAGAEPIAPTPPARDDAGVAFTARVLEPDALAAGRIAGRLGELRFRAARGELGACPTDTLAPLAADFADARVHPDTAPWGALRDRLDAALASLVACRPDVAPALAQITAWRSDLPVE